MLNNLSHHGNPRFLVGNIIRCSLILLVAGCLEKQNIAEIIKDSEPIFAVHENIIANANLESLPISIPLSQSIYEWPYGDYYSELGAINFSFPGNYTVRKRIEFKAANSTFNHVNMPIIVDNRMVIADARGLVTATDLKTYNTLWQFNIKSIMGSDMKSFRYAAISYGGEKVFLATNNGYIVALSFLDGSMLWKVNPRMPFNSPWKYRNDTIYGISATNTTFAINAKNGEVLWQHDGLTETRMTINQPSVLLHLDTASVLSSHSSGEIVSLRESTGAVIWGYNITSLTKEHDSSFKFSDIDANPVLFNQEIMISGGLNGSLTASRIGNGAIMWQKPYGVTSQMAPVGEFLFFINDAGNLVCLHGLTGEVKWIKELKTIVKVVTPRYINQGMPYKSVHIHYHGPVMINDSIVLISHLGKLFRFDPQDGRLLEERRLGFPVHHSPIIVDQKIYLVNDKSGYVAVLE